MLIGVAKFGQKSEETAELFSTSARMKPFANHSKFTFGYGEHMRTIIYPPNDISIMHIHDKFKKVEALCSVLERIGPKESS